MRYYKLNVDGSVVYSCTTKPTNEETLYLEDAPNKFSRWDGKKWIEDVLLKTEYDKNEALMDLQQTDSDMVRVLEDLISLLITKGVITINDFPVDAVQKINSRNNNRKIINKG